MSKLAIIGAGAMGQAIAKGLSAAGLYASKEIALFDVRSEVLEALKAHEFSTCENLDHLISEIDDNGILLIAVKPQNIDDLLKEVHKLRENVIIVSICAGTKIAKFEQFFPRNPIVRVMPNTPAQIAKGASVLAPNSKCSSEQVEKIQKIFASMGLALVLDESKLDAVTALSGSGPAYVFYLIEAMGDAGMKLGLDEAASRALARETVYGAACLVVESGKPAKELRAQVTSPNGTTQAAIESFEGNKFKEIVAEALNAACKRSQELA